MQHKAALDETPALHFLFAARDGMDMDMQTGDSWDFYLLATRLLCGCRHGWLVFSCTVVLDGAVILGDIFFGASLGHVLTGTRVRA